LSERPIALVRRAEPGDLQAVSELFFEYFDAMGLPAKLRDEREEIERYLSAPRAAWLALVDGALAGTTALRPIARLERVCEIKRLYVRPARRGLGIAHALLDAFESFAAGSGYREAYLDSRSDMLDAHAFYRRRGYVRCERYNDNPDAAVFMRRSLAE